MSDAANREIMTAAKTPSASAVEMTELVLPNDTKSID